MPRPYTRMCTPVDATNNPAAHHRRSIRLPGYDYRQAGAYFITVCTRNRTMLFGDVVNDEMRLNEAGRIAEKVWREIPDHFDNVDIDAFIAMPNHVHGIIVITYTHVGARHASPLHRPHRQSKPTLGTIVGSYKSTVTNQINRSRGNPGAPVWQRNYYEHVIRNETALHGIRQYIIHNPAKWADDPNNPRNMTQSP